VYDILLTLDIEINLVWPAPLSVVKGLFLLNRYLIPGVYLWVTYMLSGLANPNLDDTYCFNFFMIILMLQVLTNNCFGASLILLRVYALYNRDKRILLTLSALLLLELSTAFGISVWASVYARDAGWIVFVPLFDTCAFTAYVSWLWVVFPFMILYDVTVFVLILRKTWEHVSKTNSRTSLLSTLLIDGLWYFLVMLAGELLNLIAFASFPSTLFLVGLNIMWCINATMVSRIFLNLRNTASPQDWTQLTAFKQAEPSDDAPITTFGHRHRVRNIEQTVVVEGYELDDVEDRQREVPA